MSKSLELSFNTQPPEGGWKTGTASKEQEKVSTHSRLKAAGWIVAASPVVQRQFQHTAA